MPKKFEFTGFRKYDPNATVEEQQYEKGVDYWGGDTRVYLKSRSEGSQYELVGCMRNLSGGALYNEFADTSCYGQLHKSYMQRQQDSEPIQVVMSALSTTALKITYDAFKGKQTLYMMIIYPNADYIESLVRVERIEPNTSPDSPFEYTVTYRRVWTPNIGSGIYYATYDLEQGCKFATEEKKAKYTLHPFYYSNEDVTIPPPSAFKSPYETAEVNLVNAYALTGQLVSQNGGTDDVQYQIKENLRITPMINVKTIDVEYVWNPEGVLSGQIPSSKQRLPIHTLMLLPTQDDAPEVDSEWYRLNGWKRIDSENVYPPGTEVILTEKDTKIIAVWVRVYKVSYEDGGKECIGLPQVQKYGSGTKITVSGPVTFDGSQGQYWKFTRWHEVNTNTDYEPNAQITIADKDITLEAVWEKQYKVKYMLKAGDGSTGATPVDDNLYSANGSVTMMSATPSMTKEGYTFKGWKLVGKTRLYQPSAVVSIANLVSETDFDLVFEAQWELHNESYDHV